MFAVIASALALAGAPATADVHCDPVIDLWALGATYPTLNRTLLGTSSCAGVLIAGMSPVERARTQQLNPKVDVYEIEGIGLLTLLHEARHLAGVWNECQAETFALSHVGELVGRYVPMGHRREADAGVDWVDAVAVAAGYRTGC